jgi:hypothetical protein
MKKIINGAKYDTATAKKLGEWTNGHRYGEFSYYEESLYRTKSGRYFLYGSGGAMTKYAVSSGDNSWGGGSQIITMSREAAMEWAEEHLEVEEYEAAFGEVPEGDEKEQLNIVVPAQLKAALWKMAERQNMSVSALVLDALENHAGGDGNK